MYLPNFNIKNKVFDKLIRENINQLFQFAYVRCHDLKLAEDLVQDACMKAYKFYVNNDKNIDKPKEWLFRILINTHISYLRKRQFELVGDEILENRPDLSISDDNFKDSLSSLDKLRDDISDALRQLTVDQRSVLYLVDLKGMSFKDASEILGIPFGTLTSRLHRGRLKLKKELISKGYSSKYIKSGGIYGL